MSATLRKAVPADAQELLEIYRPYVTDTAITFEYEVPTVEEFVGRIQEIQKRYPYLVVEEDGVIQGYVYASSFKGRPAYDWSVETSIYVREGARGKGYGRMLYQSLEDILRKQHVLNVNACIAYTESKDPFLTNGSQLFHQHMGYKMVGKFTQSGYKFHCWYDMIWMEKMLGEHPIEPAPFVPVTQIDDKLA